MTTYDILLINAHRDHFGSVAGDISIGVNLLAQFLKERGYHVGMFRGFAHHAEQWLENSLETSGARSIGFYCDYENSTLVAEFSRRVKDRWGLPVFVGGPQAVGLDKDFFLRSRCDAVVRGEGEYTLLELLDGYFRGGKHSSQIEGVSYLNPAGNLVHRPERKPLEDLDALPWPDFRMEEGSDSWTMIPVMTGRGCPFRCAFCYEGGNTKRVRYRSVRNVVEEIVCQFRRHPQCNYILFLDDTFTLDPGRVEELCVELKRLRQERDFVWFCEGHVQTLLKWPKMLDDMVSAGLAKLVLGIESGSNEVLNLYGKKTSVEMVEAVVQNAVSAGVPLLSGNIIIGGPAESRETIRLNGEFISRLLHSAPGRLDLSVFFLMPYPNTAIIREPHRFGLRLLLDRQTQCMADIPLTETENLSWFDLFPAGRELNRNILFTMKELYTEGKVPSETIVSNYRLAAQYGIVSNWLVNVFAADSISHEYYRQVAGGGLCPSENIPAADFFRWYPRRVFTLWDTISFENGAPVIGKRALSPLEYQLLVGSSGKVRLSELLKSMYNSFGESYKNSEAFQADALQLLRILEDDKLIAFAPV